MKKIIFSGLVALGLLAIGCGENQVAVEEEVVESGEAIMYITLKGSNTSTRATTGSNNEQFEDAVNSFAAYVFNYTNGALEEKKEFTGVSEGVIDNLKTASHKLVVVLVNYPGAYPDILSYGDLLKTTLTLQSQDPALISTNGLFMSGESTEVTLVEGVNNVITVDVSRVVAKVRLASLVINPNALYPINNFTLKGVSMQRVPNKTSIYGDLLSSTEFDYVGGWQLSNLLQYKADYLYEALVLPINYVSNVDIIDVDDKPYFYVFPNNELYDNSTLLTIHGVYDGKDIFFSFKINDKSGAQPSTTNGEWIKRNNIYDLYVTLENIAIGSEDPNTPNEFVSANVVVNILGWALPITQYETW